jgi:hypothetical protein
VKIKILALFAALMGTVLTVTPPAQAVAPSEFNYQGKLTDATGNPVNNAPYNIKFDLFTDQQGTLPINACSVTNTAVQVTNGLFNTLVNFPTGCFTNNKDVWMKVTVGSTPLSPLQKLAATPYALAVAAGSVGDAEISAVTASKITPGTFGNGDYTFTGNLTLPAGSAPTHPDQVVNKRYVDALSAGPRFMGATAISYTGALGGFIGANAKCDLDYPGSHFCTGDDMVRSGMKSPPASRMWVMRDSFHAGSSCNTWTDGTNSFTGPVVGGFNPTFPSVPAGNLYILGCLSRHSLACCK